MMKIRIGKSIILMVLAIAGTTIGMAGEKKISLAGAWKFTTRAQQIDGLGNLKSHIFDDQIFLPGSMASNGKGDDITLKTPWTGQIVDSSWFKKPEYAKYRKDDNLKIPAWLQPVKYYKGVAYYSREIEVTPVMAGRPLELCFERVHWESTLWIDGMRIGMCNALGTPHRYTVSPLSLGKHTITIAVDNRIKDIDVGFNAHSISDHTQSNWNGIVGQMSLTALDEVIVKNVAIYPDTDKSQVKVEVWTENFTEEDKIVTVNLSANSKYAPKLHQPGKISNRVTASKGLTKHEITYPMGDSFFRWDEFTPYYYSMSVGVDEASVKKYDFGMRKFESRGRRFYINERPVFLRGTLECAIFPKTGYPAMDEDEWARIFNVCKSHGLNHVRFHSWCPPRAAFKAADCLGVYLQVEGGGWCKVGDGGGFDKWIYAESDRIIAEYGNHPSFVLYTYGNEPDGANQAAFLGELVDYLKAKDPRHLYTSAAGWPMVKENEYRNDMSPRLKVWGQASPLNAERPRYDYQFDKMIADCAIPYVSHEIGQWCVYPDFKEIDKYSEAVLQAKNFEIFRETLRDNGLEEYAEQFLLASGKLQTLLYKAEIESALRTKDFAGFQLLDLHDFPGQGTALVGVLNPFWESKGYVTPEEYHHFSSSIVPLVRTDKVIYTNEETLEIPVEIANFSAAELKNVVPTWRLIRENGEEYASGNLSKQTISLGNCISLGTIRQSLAMLQKAEQLTLVVDVPGGLNSWNFWVYPVERRAESGDVRVVSELDKSAIEYLKKGGSVMFTPKKDRQRKSDVKTGFSTIFWNSAWTAGHQPPLTLGLLCDTEHPALKNFPTDYHSDNQWYELITDAAVVDFTALSSDVKPFVRVIDDWFKNRSLGLIFEVKYGKGKLLYCGADLLQNSEYPEIKHMYNCLIRYMNSAEFNPNAELTEKQLLEL